MRFTEQFSVARDAAEGWFDPVLSLDTPLFIDPFLIYAAERGEFIGSHAEIITFFNSMFKMIAAAHGDRSSLSYKKALGDLRFPEVQDLCLGYTATGTRGSGSGKEIARDIAGAAAHLGNRHSNGVDDMARQKKPADKRPAETKPAAKKPVGTKPPQPVADTSPVESIKHTGERRPNIPTREQGNMVADDERRPKTILYPRDPSLDPQLVWKGKDEQDREPLEVPAVPIYIQEKIHPQHLIEDLRSRSAAGKPQVASLFSDFNGETDTAKRTEFYQHDNHWTNRMILGDSLLVMTSLAEKERLKGRVQTIYLDPPYGIKFGSNWQVSTRKRDVKDAKAEDATRQPEQIKAFRDTWEYGVNSYLTVLRDRLTVARELLTESGSVFMQIGDENVHLVRCVMDEVFGSENFAAQISFKKTTAQSAEILAGAIDYLLLYAKDLPNLKYRQLYRIKEVGGLGGNEYQYALESNTAIRRLTEDELRDPSLIPSGTKVFSLDNLTSQRPPGTFPVEFQGRVFSPKTGYWKTGEPGMEKLIAAQRVNVSGSILKYRRFFDDFVGMPIANYWDDTSSGASRSDPKLYVVQTNMRVLERCLLMTTDPGDLVLDPTCGSGTTANVAEQWGRRWITIDTSRVALALARTRLMAAKFPYYLLADSPDGRKQETELTRPPTRRRARTTFAADSSTSAYPTSRSRASPTIRTSYPG